MRRIALAFAIAVSIAIIGCSSASSKLVGTWKGELLPSSKSDNALEKGLKGLVSGLLGPMTIEFNSNGRYKASVSVGSETGSYSVSGNDVTFTPDKQDENSSNKNHINLKTFVLSADGTKLDSKKEFDSDSVLELKKQQ